MLLCLVAVASLALATDLSAYTQYPAGMYKVGSDIPAGAYVAIATPNAIIPMVSVKDGSGADANIGYLSTFRTFTIVGVRDGEYVDVSEAFLVDMRDAADYIASLVDSEIGEGTYLVGTHIPAGEYKYVPDDGGIIPMISVYSDPYQDSIIDVVLPSGNGYITFNDGDYVTLSEVTLLK